MRNWVEFFGVWSRSNWLSLQLLGLLFPICFMLVLGISNLILIAIFWE